jgi:hypothetical protein
MGQSPNVSLQIANFIMDRTIVWRDDFWFGFCYNIGQKRAKSDRWSTPFLAEVMRWNRSVYVDARSM